MMPGFGMNVRVSPFLPMIKPADRVPAHPIIKCVARFLPITPYVELSPEKITHCFGMDGQIFVSEAAYNELRKS